MFDFLKRRADTQVKYLHVAIDINGIEKWSQRHRLSLEDGYARGFFRVRELMESQVEQKIPILTFLILPLYRQRIRLEAQLEGPSTRLETPVNNKDDQIQVEKTELLKGFKTFIEGDFFRTFLSENKIKVTLLGKWYDLPSEILVSLKKIVEETKEYDHFFLNFCLNYDGQEEIVDAFKIIARQLLAGKLSLENISRQTIKENIYSSYFLPPDIGIKNSSDWIDSFFLWDCVGAKRVFTGKEFPDFTRADFEKILKS